MKTRVITSIFITAVLVSVLLLSETPVFSVALSILAVIAAGEVLRVFDLDKKRLMSVPAYIIAAVMPTLSYFMLRVFALPEYKFIVALALVLVLVVIPAASNTCTPSVCSARTPSPVRSRSSCQS